MLKVELWFWPAQARPRYDTWFKWISHLFDSDAWQGKIWWNNRAGDRTNPTVPVIPVISKDQRTPKTEHKFSKTVAILSTMDELKGIFPNTHVNSILITEIWSSPSKEWDFWPRHSSLCVKARLEYYEISIHKVVFELVTEPITELGSQKLRMSRR